MAWTLSKLLDHVPPQFEQRVDQARHRHNNEIRDHLRKETRLLLNQGETADDDDSRHGAISVPVRVLPGAPEEFLNIPLDGINEVVWLLGLYRGTLLKFTQSSNELGELFRQLSQTPVGIQILGDKGKELPRLRAFAKELLDRLDTARPLDVILNYNEDILGHYAYRLPQRQDGPVLFDLGDPIEGIKDNPSAEIRLYWGVIAFIAADLNVSVEELTIVVLAHELAHAYTHLGADSDGRRWPTSRFADADHELKEGLAQYYTFRICSRMQNTVPGALEAYRSLLSHQPPAYRTHEKWIDDRSRPEDIRSAMIELRRTDSCTLAEFEGRLAVARQRLGNRTRTEAQNHCQKAQHAHPTCDLESRTQACPPDGFEAR